MGEQDTILKAILDIKDDITELTGEVKKNNGVKDLIHQNATAIEKNTEAIGGCSAVLSDHLTKTDTENKIKKTRKIDFKWVAIFLLAISNLASAILLR